MKLITEKQQERIPELYAQESVSDPIVYLKITCMNAFWLITELDKGKGLAFGYAQIIEGGGELGYISLEEINELRENYYVSVKAVEEPLSKLKAEFGL
ncbi:DUF2958 domain-containing protein [Sulfuricurvum sp.]|uniref:DUF2958 domain-containing protein n=1 Tax=Sulfuricurvum sp. TaxID=2025608 RepID=UPI00262D9F63|nr:DUF2958 domain-containing protein [Sulfuricurvum sp.]MDD4950499.1 DUF2958 domain-containing protein [Sulfuricurvum sp.]